MNSAQNSDLTQYFIDNLDAAISNEWIKAYHQPLVRAASGRVSDEEALARWEDPEKGVFSASEFIPALEQAGLTYKLDLYMVNRVLNKMKGQGEHGLFIVPESVNLSKSDFECCDMVSEVLKIIDKSGLPREKLSIELSERDIASDVDFMKDIVERLRKEGIKVWMDDYGSGYSSMLILLKIKFDLLKVDKVFVDQISEQESGRIILTELIKTALALGMDTVAEGVETKEQADFLNEIGCTKLQGYYYTKPISLADIINRNLKGIQIGFENPAEAEYYEQLGRVNLYDLSISRNDEATLSNYFDTMPMVIFSIDYKEARFIRCNKSYREFIDTYFPESKKALSFAIDSIKPGVGYYSFNAARQCAIDGKRIIIDDRFSNGCTVQLFMRRIAVNPITKSSAVAIAVLSLTPPGSNDSLTYNYIARALSEDYLNLYYVDLDTDRYTEYISDGSSRDITLEGKGTRFFDLDRPEFPFRMTSEDKEELKKAFTKDVIIKGLEETGTFSIVTKLFMNDELVFVSIKAVKVRGEGNHIIVGLSNVDNQIKAKEALDRIKEERLIYSRIGALSGDYIFVYTVDPQTFHYTKNSPSNMFLDRGISSEGDGFFDAMLEKAPNGVHPEDLDQFITAFTPENIMDSIRKKGFFENHHRLLYEGKYIYVVMRGAMVRENDKDKLIIGILNIDERVRQEQEYEMNLFAAETKANIDELTGVKNKHAYAEAEHKMDEKIAQKDFSDFAIGVFDINGLKQVNDTLGHKAGDDFIRNGCNRICHSFNHSPVYRVGGDEFVVIIQGEDYENVDSILVDFSDQNIKNHDNGEVVIAAGISRFNQDSSVASVFERADAEMYENKKKLKGLA